MTIRVACPIRSPGRIWLILPFPARISAREASPAAAKKIATRLDTGMVWINSTSRSAPDLPFGGVKRSGVGRELAKFGINEFANKKLVRTP